MFIQIDSCCCSFNFNKVSAFRIKGVTIEAYLDGNWIMIYYEPTGKDIQKIFSLLKDIKGNMDFIKYPVDGLNIFLNELSNNSGFEEDFDE